MSVAAGRIYSTLSGLLLFGLFVYLASAGEIETNSARMANAPNWLARARVQQVNDKIEKVLEWPINRVTVVWHGDQAEFEKLHGFGPLVLAYSSRPENTVHLGPRVDTTNFDQVYGHELVHIIVYQKYKTAIPSWLDEGLASYIAGEKRVDYKWLSAQPRINVTSLQHPFKGPLDSRVVYETSTAAMEMIAAKCPLHDLLELSVGKSLTTYLDTFCQIPDVNKAFNDYLNDKASGKR